MAKRMFSTEIVESDSFLDLPLSAQALYFHLSMNADDEGFTGSPKRICRMVGAAPEDLEMLEKAGFIISFQSGSIAITHWKAQNTIKADRLKETIYTSEKARLEIKNGAYSIMSPDCIQNVSKVSPDCIQCSSGTAPQISIDKNSIVEDRIDKNISDKNSIDKCRKDKDSIGGVEGKKGKENPNDSGPNVDNVENPLSGMTREQQIAYLRGN